ncbi:uncharacterized protein METZ01_LOCUS495206, partial [marine metagenome]
ILMESKDEFTGPVNLGNSNEITIKQLAMKVIELTKSNSKLSYLPLPENDPVRRQPDISLADKILGWEPTVELEEGLKHTIQDFSVIISSLDLDNKPERLEKYLKKTVTESP